MLRSCAMRPCGDQHYCTGDNDICETSDLSLHNAIISDFSERESISSFLPERTSAPSNPGAREATKNEAGRIREDENATYQEEGIDDGLLSDVESQSEDASETDSS